MLSQCCSKTNPKRNDCFIVSACNTPSTRINIKALTSYYSIFKTKIFKCLKCSLKWCLGVRFCMLYVGGIMYSQSAMDNVASPAHKCYSISSNHEQVPKTIQLSAGSGLGTSRKHISRCSGILCSGKKIEISKQISSVFKISHDILCKISLGTCFYSRLHSSKVVTVMVRVKQGIKLITSRTSAWMNQECRK